MSDKYFPSCVTASPNIASSKLGLRMTTLHEEQSSSGSHSALEMSPLLQEEEPCNKEQHHPPETAGSQKSSRANGVCAGKGDADGTHSDPEFSEFESYQVCLVTCIRMLLLKTKPLRRPLAVASCCCLTAVWMLLGCLDGRNRWCLLSVKTGVAMLDCRPEHTARPGSEVVRVMLLDTRMLWHSNHL